MGLYIKKPIVINAYHIDKETPPDWYDEALEMGFVHLEDEDAQHGKIYAVLTDRGVVYAREGDFLIKGTDEELYPCSEEIFRDIYDKVNTDL